MNNCNIIVSVRCIVFNHEPYLRQCLDGIVMQQTDFRFEAFVHDDASTDGSADIIREYAERYPDIIKPYIEEENLYSKKDGSFRRVTYSPENLRGKYIAQCEGDDYWTDPLKLQKQVDYLEAHPDCMLCFTNATMHWEDGSGKPDRLFAPNLEERDYAGPEMTADWITPTASFVFRRDILDTDFYHQVIAHPKVSIVGDIPLVLTCARFGQVHALQDVTCVYRRQANGFVLKANSRKQLAMGDYRYCLYKVFGREYLESAVHTSLYRYRLALSIAKREHNAGNIARICGRIARVYICHPRYALKRFKQVLQERKERLASQ